MDEQACREALYGGPREIRAEPLTRQADPKRAGWVPLRVLKLP